MNHDMNNDASPDTALPLFPLGTTLFPQGLLALQIFEVRYLSMIGACHKAGRPFGVVSLTQGAEVRLPGAEAEQFAEVGTLAHIAELRSPQAGLLLVQCTGGRRFRARRPALQKTGLWTADAELLPEEPALPVPPDLQPAVAPLRRLLETAQARAQAHTEAGAPTPALPVAEPYRFDDCGWVANRWCELLPLPLALRQRLLAVDSPLLRLELVSDLLADAGIPAAE